MPVTLISLIKRPRTATPGLRSRNTVPIQGLACFKTLTITSLSVVAILCLFDGKVLLASSTEIFVSNHQAEEVLVGSMIVAKEKSSFGGVDQLSCIE
jgi:hypothetical protein